MLHRLTRFAVFVPALALGISCSRQPAAVNADIERLIDQLTQVDSAALGLHSTASFTGFMAEDKPAQFAGGVLGSWQPKTFPQMQEIVRKGVAALPSLIHHLDDKRSTKLTVGGDFFTFRYFSDEYDPKTSAERYPRKNLEKRFDSNYTIRVGDVCYGLIGQIVNRALLPVRYQPTAGLIVNSPIEAPTIVTQVKRDWSGIEAAEHMASLLLDARLEDHARSCDPALQRLRYYYPEEYRSQRTGDLGKKIEALESREKTPEK